MRGEDVRGVGPGASAGTPADEEQAPLFSLPLGEGSGALLAAAAGDVAGGADPHGYSALTQTATTPSPSA